MTMTPRAPASSSGCRPIVAAASRSTLNVATRYESRVVLNPSRSSGWPSRPMSRPPLAGPPWTSTTARTVPSVSATARAAVTLASSDASVWTYRTEVPSSSARCSPFSSATSAMTTDAPAAVNRRTVAAPMPPVPPTTTATFPASSTSYLLDRVTTAVVLLSRREPMLRWSARRALGLSAADDVTKLQTCTQRDPRARGCPGLDRGGGGTGEYAPAMALAITEDHRALAATVADFLTKHRVPRGGPRPARGGRRRVPPPFWAELGGLGWLGLHCPRSYGGSGFGLAELVVVVEQLGRRLAPGAVRPDRDRQRRARRGRAPDAAEARLLPGLADGAIAGAVALGGDRLAASGIAHGVGRRRARRRAGRRAARRRPVTTSP